MVELFKVKEYTLFQANDEEMIPHIVREIDNELSIFEYWRILLFKD